MSVEVAIEETLSVQMTGFPRIRHQLFFD